MGISGFTRKESGYKCKNRSCYGQTFFSKWNPLSPYFDKKAITEKKTMTGKEKKPSLHERLEINKRIIQEKQEKDKPERGTDSGVRTV